MKIIVEYPKSGQHKKTAIESINLCNAVQNYFHFIYSDTDSITESAPIIPENVCSRMNNEEKWIYLTDKFFNDNWFSHEYRNNAIITLYDWEKLYSPPSLKSYIIYQMAQATIHFSANISEEIALRIVHEPPIGCMYDMCSKKPDIKYGMRSGILCPECKGKLLQYGTANLAINSVEGILEVVRSEAIGKPKRIEINNAFVVMRFSSNDENDNAYRYGIQSALAELSINCIRADTEIKSGQLLEKIKSQIDKSRYIIAKVDNENLNVYLELGYALGQNKDVILISEEKLRIIIPSDLSNWECITYPQGNYEALKRNLIKFINQNYHLNVKNPNFA